jgi:phosphopantetheine adenylyltransferase
MIALYPGAFKPPHRGHFEVVKRLLKGNHGGQIYTKDSASDAGSKALAGQSGKVEKINKVIVFPGGGERNGITKGESIAIWKIYSKYLPGIEVRDGEKNPMFAAKDYAKANPDEPFYAITGVRDESDFSDLKRITTFNNTNNVQGVVIPSAQGSGVRASDLRKAALQGSLDDIVDFFPNELSREELFKIMRMLKDNIIAEIMNQKMENLFEAMFETANPQDGKAAPYGSGYKKVDELQLQDYIGSLLEYMLDKKMNITPLPEIKIRHDEDNSKDFFGKTAYYDPNLKEIVLFVDGRHNKDIVRSFSHEMVHHIQNLEGRLNNIQTSDTTSDNNLLKIEAEAYMEGNITFRNWEDNIKNSKVMAEGKYDKISNDLSSAIFKVFKNAYDKGKEVKDSFRIGPEPDADYEHSLEFDLDIYMKLTDDTYSVDGGANAGLDKEGNEIQPLINVVFELPKDVNWRDVSFDIKDVIRHEIEHLTQDGENEKQGKYIPDDQVLRDLIDAGMLDKDEYYKLPKEVDAMIQGMYYKAKKSKTPFSKVVDDYFDKAKVTPEERPKIKALWNKRIPALGIKQRL